MKNRFVMIAFFLFGFVLSTQAGASKSSLPLFTLLNEGKVISVNNSMGKVEMYKCLGGRWVNIGGQG